MAMKDPEIRAALMSRLRVWFSHVPDAMIVPELDIRGRTRIDVSVISSKLDGWEIKSGRDSLQRLPHQVEIYGRVLDSACLVVTECHRAEAVRMIPKWWGAEVAVMGVDGKVELTELRRSRPNPCRDELMITGLLWKVETIQLMREHNMSARQCRGSVRQLQKRLLAEVSFYIIHERVCQQLRIRQGALRGTVV